MERTETEYLFNQPFRWIQIYILRFNIRSPVFWYNYFLFRIDIQPGSPPAECTVGDDIMFA